MTNKIAEFCQNGDSLIDRFIVGVKQHQGGAAIAAVYVALIFSIKTGSDNNKVRFPFSAQIQEFLQQKLHDWTSKHG